MCNLYSVTRSQTAIREAARAMVDRTGNLPPLPGIFPDYRAPIVREGPDGRELAIARWGMPSPRHALEGKCTDSVQFLCSSSTIMGLTAMQWFILINAHPVYTILAELAIISASSWDRFPTFVRLTVPIIFIILKGAAALVIYTSVAGALNNGWKEQHADKAIIVLLKIISNIAETLISFGMIYRETGVLLNNERTRSRINCFYFSVVAWTTVGFGDVVPENKLTRLIVSCEVILGYFTLICLASILITYAGYAQQPHAP